MRTTNREHSVARNRRHNDYEPLLNNDDMSVPAEEELIGGDAAGSAADDYNPTRTSSYRRSHPPQTSEDLLANEANFDASGAHVAFFYPIASEPKAAEARRKRRDYGVDYEATATITEGLICGKEVEGEIGVIKAEVAPVRILYQSVRL